MDQRERALAIAARLRSIGQPESFVKIVKGSSPSVGAELTLTIPGDQLWALRAFRCTLTTSAAVVNRLVTVFVDDGSTEYLRTTLDAAIVASTTAAVQFFAGAGTAYQNGATNIGPLPAPEALLWPGSRIRTVTAAIDAGDQYSAIVAYVTDIAVSNESANLARELTQLIGSTPESPYEEARTF